MEEVIFVIILFLVVASFVDDANTSLRLQPNRLISYSLPDKRPLKKSLGFHEDTYLNFTELTSKYGYDTEKHRVTTEDGYILTVFRILPKCNEAKNVPVILMHGLYDSSDEWILTGPKTGLGYVLARNCYDVWAANHRGNVYSRLHARLDPNRDPEYWNYSFDEQGYYDLPAIIDFVIDMTKKPKISYIGHSQGTTDFFAMASLRPEYNSKVSVSIQLAPVAWLKYSRSPIPLLLAPRSDDVRNLLTSIGFYEIFGKNQLEHFILEFLCHYNPVEVCGTVFTLTTGYRQGNISPRNLAVASGHLLAGVSVKEFDHLAQLIASGKFRRYNEGRQGNLKRYGSPKPPEYNVSQISSPVVLICAENDWLSNLKDVDILASRLPLVVEKYVVPDPSWSHNDHIFGVHAKKYVFSKILEHLNRYS